MEFKQDALQTFELSRLKRYAHVFRMSDDERLPKVLILYTRSQYIDGKGAYQG